MLSAITWTGAADLATRAAGYKGADTLSLSDKDTTDSLTGTAGVSTTVNPAPTVTAPSKGSVDENGSLTFSTANGNAIKVTDASASGKSDSLTLAVSHGKLTLGSTTGLTFSGGLNGSAEFTVTGTLAKLNAALNGLIYRPNSGYVGSDALLISIKDSLDNLEASASVAITVTAQLAVTSDATVVTSVSGNPAPQQNLMQHTNGVSPLVSAEVYSVATDPDYEAVQWAGLSAAVEILYA